MSEMQSVEQTKRYEDRYQLGTYTKMSISLERGQGCYVYDSDGKAYLDFYGGHAVVSTGHCHPKVVQAIQEQAARLIFYSNVAYSDVRARAVARLIEMAGPPYHQVFLANSGSEANENAIKLARAATQRPEIISITGSFHGRTYGSLSATGIEKYVSYLNTPVPMHRSVPPEQVADEVSQITAAVLVEPIQSMGGVREIPLEILTKIQSACRRNGAYLVFDEVQTGVARTGTFLYSGRGEVYADMVTLAKGIASGFPASALLVTEVLAEKVKPGDLGTTFGGSPLACASLEATLEVIQEEKLAENAQRMGDYIRENAQGMDEVVEVRGRGLLLGLRLRTKAKEIQRLLLEKQILVGSSDDPFVLRLMPPLNITRQEAASLLKALSTLEEEKR